MPELRSLTLMDPHDERVWELLVRALGRSGRRPEALRAAQVARTALAEVGLDPGSALRHAEAGVLAGDGGRPAAAPEAGSGPSTGGEEHGGALWFAGDVEPIVSRVEAALGHI